jgi:uncharacterized protein (DUF302 family)
MPYQIISHARAFAAVLALAIVMSVATLGGKSALAQGGSDMPDMVVVTPSGLSFPETVARFEEEVKTARWSLLNRTNMAGILSEQGFTLDPVMIFDACSGRYSAAILKRDDARPMTAFMPCRVAIYQTANGEVFFSRMNTAAFAPMLTEEIAEIMLASDKEISAIIEAVVAR